MSWFSTTKPKEPHWWEKLDRDYPPGSEWVYLGRLCVVLRTHDWTYDGLPFSCPAIQYVDDRGVIHTAEVSLSALVRPSDEKPEYSPPPGKMAVMRDGKYHEEEWPANRPKEGE